MISMQVYPVMDGVEIWVAASCMTRSEGHWEHKGDSVAFFVGGEEMDRKGVLVAVLRQLEVILSENPSITARVRC